MAVRERIYRLEIGLAEKKFAKLKKQAWDQGFDEPEGLVSCLINKHLRGDKEKLLKNNFQTVKAELITSYLLLLAYAHNQLEYSFETLDSIISHMNGFRRKIIVRRYCPKNKTLGKILREAKTNFNYQIEKSDVYSIYFWLMENYPEKKEIIKQQIQCSFGRPRNQKII